MVDRGPGRVPTTARERLWWGVRVPGGGPRPVWEDDDGPRRGRRWGLVLVGVGVVAVVLAFFASCSGGSDDAGPAATFAPRPTTGLAARLIAPPADSVPGTSAWARDYTPTVTQLVEHLYQRQAARRTITADLRRQGLQEVAHVLWLGADAEQVDTVLLRFGTEAGAEQRLRFVTSTNRGGDGVVRTALGGTGSPVLYVGAAPVGTGYHGAKLYARVGTVVVEMFVYSRTDVATTPVERWARAQIAKL